MASGFVVVILANGYVAVEVKLLDFIRSHELSDVEATDIIVHGKSLVVQIRRKFIKNICLDLLDDRKEKTPVLELFRQQSLILRANVFA